MDEDNEHILELLRLLKEKEIKLLAIDFDSTLISIHTGGMWIGSVEQLARYVRPMFIKLLNSVIDTTSIKVAVVTFSTQTELIAKVLKRVLNNPNGVYVQTTTRELQILNKKKPGKETHISYVLRNIFRNHGMKINGEEIFLIDDDEENIDIAVKSNHLAFCFKEETTLRSIIDYLNGSFAPSNLSLVVNFSSDSNVSKNATKQCNSSKAQAEALEPQDLNTNAIANVHTQVPFSRLQDLKKDGDSNNNNNNNNKTNNSYLKINQPLQSNINSSICIPNENNLYFKNSTFGHGSGIPSSAVVYISNNVTPFHKSNFY